MITQTKSKLGAFAEDVRTGLSAETKYLSSKYFYDDEGSRLFQRIMELPEYYLTRAETEVFETQKAAIVDSFLDGRDSFDLIELGAGDGTKTAILIDHLLSRGVDFNYSPIDISSKAIEILTDKFSVRFPGLSIKPVHGDYFHGLESLKEQTDRAKIVFFLGSNIGNFTYVNSVYFLEKIKAALNPGDFLFIGIDLQKDPQIILDAYDDSQGVTAAFNYNLLTRINRELGGSFAIEKFLHYATYSPIEGAARSFLLSREEQAVRIEAIDTEFRFRAWEPVYMEISQKYNLPMIESIAARSGFSVVTNFFDSRVFFADSLWKCL